MQEDISHRAIWNRSGYAQSFVRAYKTRMEIEVFRADSAAAAAAGITAADLADVAAFDCAANPIPYVLGHPSTDKPALGPIRSFRAEGATLIADVDEKAKGFRGLVQSIKDGTILNRSMAFFSKSHPSNPTPGKLAPKHLGFLGSAAPGIPGMPALVKSLAFAEGDEIEVIADAAAAVVFDAPPTEVIHFSDKPKESNVAELTPEQLAEQAATLKRERDEHDAAVKAFAAEQKARREADNAATVERLVTEAKVLPADKDDLVAAFNAIDGGEVIAFASDATKKASPVSIIAGIIAKGGKVAPVDEGQHSPSGAGPQFSAGGGNDELAKARAERLAKYNQ